METGVFIAYFCLRYKSHCAFHAFDRQNIRSKCAIGKKYKNLLKYFFLPVI